MAFGKRHKPFQYMTPSFQTAVFSALERAWSKSYGRHWRREYDKIVPAMTTKIRRQRELLSAKG